MQVVARRPLSLRRLCAGRQLPSAAIKVRQRLIGQASDWTGLAPSTGFSLTQKKTKNAPQNIQVPCVRMTLALARPPCPHTSVAACTPPPPITAPALLRPWRTCHQHQSNGPSPCAWRRSTSRIRTRGWRGSTSTPGPTPLSRWVTDTCSFVVQDGGVCGGGWGWCRY